MKNSYIAPAIMLIAGAITSILNLYNGIGFMESLKRLFIALIIFYIIGRITARYIYKITKPSKKTKKQDDQQSNKQSASKEASESKE